MDEFELKITSIRTNRPTVLEDPYSGARKRDQENGRLAALEHCPEAIARVVQIMRTSADENTVLKACFRLMDQGYGKPQAAPTDDPKLANKSMLDIFEHISISHARVEQEARQRALEARPVHPAAQVDLTSDYGLIGDASD